MSDHDVRHPQPAPRREPLAPESADALRAYAARTREQADSLAAVLEDIAVNGLPAPEDCVAWEELRETKLAQLHTGQGHAA